MFKSRVYIAMSLVVSFHTFKQCPIPRRYPNDNRLTLDQRFQIEAMMLSNFQQNLLNIGYKTIAQE